MKASIRDVDVAGKRVLVREDLNVPLKDGRVTDETRIEAAAPTLRELAERRARVIVTSHLGRPKGGPDPQFSLEPVAPLLARRLGRQVSFARDCVGSNAESAVEAMEDGDVVLLENVRFHPEEEKNDPAFARALAGLGEIYCNDAFAASHRAHASVVGVAECLPAYAGDLMLAELHALHRALDEPRRPLVAIVGGAKVSTKAGVLRHLLPRVDTLIVCGAMANTFFAARGIEMGSSLVEPEAFEEARDVERQAGEKLVLPVDGVVAREMEPGQETRTVAMDAVQPGWKVLDVGPKTRELYSERVRDAGTIVWNGSPGVFEIPEFGQGPRPPRGALSATAA